MSKKDMDRRKKFILELMGDPIYQPMRLREISSLLRLSKEEKRELYDVLDELCEEGKVSVDRKGRYEKVKGKWKKKKDDRYYDDRREEYGSEYGRKKKDKNKKDKNKRSVKYYAQLTNRQIATLFDISFLSSELDYEIGDRLSNELDNPKTAKLLKDIEKYKNIKTTYTEFKNTRFTCNKATYDENGRITYMYFTEN